MKNSILLPIFILSILNINAQYEYDVTDEHPYGQLNPNAPKQTADYAQLIGECDCKSTARNQDGTWTEPVDMIWRWKYIMNGMGVQDETLKSDGKHSGSIRQYSKDSLRWYVHYYSSLGVSTTLGTWEGNKNDDGDIVLYKDSPAPNGTAGDYRLTFSNISDNGFDWIGEWVDKSESVVFPTWKITCTKREED